MSDSTRELLERQVSAQLDGWIEALDHIDEDRTDAEHPADCEPCDYYDEDADRFDVLDTEALSVAYDWTGPTRADANVYKVRIVLATGGPHVEIIAEVGRDALRIEGYWGGDTVRRYFSHGPTEALAAELAEIAEVSG